MSNDALSQHGRTRKDAARRIREQHGLPCTENTLANLASHGHGPTYRLIAGRSFYLDQNVDAWAKSRISAPINKASDARRSDVREVA